MEKYLAPEPIREGELPEQWLRFKREFNQFLTAVGKADATSAVKMAIFLRVVGPRVNDMYETMTFTETEDKNDFGTVVAKLDELCARRTSKHVIRDKFFQLKQEGRTIDLFMTEIRKHAKDCAFGELKDDLMLHVLIRGLDCERMRRRLFETDELTLEKAIRKCRTMEATSADLQLWSGKKEEEVAAIAQGATVKKKQEYKPPKRQSQKKNLWQVWATA